MPRFIRSSSELPPEAGIKPLLIRRRQNVGFGIRHESFAALKVVRQRALTADTSKATGACQPVDGLCSARVYRRCEQERRVWEIPPKQRPPGVRIQSQSGWWSIAANSTTPNPSAGSHIENRELSGQPVPKGAGSSSGSPNVAGKAFRLDWTSGCQRPKQPSPGTRNRKRPVSLQANADRHHQGRRPSDTQAPAHGATLGGGQPPFHA